MIRLRLRADGVFVRLGDSIFSLHGGRLTAITDPDANQRAIHFKQAPHQLPNLHVARHLPYSLIAWWRHTSGLSTRALALRCVENRQTEVTVARSLLGEDFAWYVGFFFLSPPLLGRQRCSWWILKQISLIIVFHNCHAERDCPLRSYLCHCTPPPPTPHAHTTTTSTALPLQTLQ